MTNIYICACDRAGLSFKVEIVPIGTLRVEGFSEVSLLSIMRIPQSEIMYNPRLWKAMKLFEKSNH